MSVTIVSEEISAPSEVAESLASALFGTMIATTKAQTYHWNVTGMSFGSLHALFKQIYEDHFAAQDRIAERIRTLGYRVDGRPSTALERSLVRECEGAIDAKSMVARLAQDERTLSDALTATARMAEDQGDIVTHDLAIERMDVHQKFAWMLEAHLAD